MRRLTNVCLPQPMSKDGISNLWYLLLDDKGLIVSVKPMGSESSISGENWCGDWLSPMGIDLQINGGFGINFSDLTFDDIPKLIKLLDRLWLDGVEAICPTFISCDIHSLRMGLKVVNYVRLFKMNNQRCGLLGAHLEGPFIAKKRHGAHPLESLCTPSLNALDERINGFEDQIALVTIAPELQGSIEVIKKLKSLGVVVCLGHSEANADISRYGFDNGIVMLTHTFNAMPGLNHRSPGPIGEAIKDGGIAMGLIADGVHVDPSIAVILHRLSPSQLVLVSDAIAPYGLKEGKCFWGQRWVNSKNGTCRLQDGTLAGCSLSLLEACKRFYQWNQDPASSIWAATISPRLVLGQIDKIESYFIGQPIKKLLRWTVNHDSQELSWQRAV